ncbi:hypothetical protein GCM10009797_41770 [Nocardioides hwasunensis]
MGSGPFPYVVDWSYDVSASGVGYALWSSSGSSKRVVMAARRSPSGTWSRPKRMTAPFNRTGKLEYAGHTDVAVDIRGRATAVWTQSRGDSVRVMVATSNKAGKWSRPRALSPKGERAAFPYVAVSDAGHAAITWAPDFWFTTKSRPINVVATYRSPGSGWEAPVQLTGDPAWDVDSRAQSIVMDDRGVASLVWPEIPGGDYSTQRVRTATHAPGGAWGVETVSEGTQALSPQVATTADGQAVVAWTGSKNIQLRRRGPDGVWGPVETAITFALGNFTDVGIAPTGRVAISGHVIDQAMLRRRHFLVVQDVAGGAWTQSWTGKARREYAWTIEEASMAIAASGAVTITWEEPGTKGWSPRRVRRYSAAGSWGPVREIGRYSMNAVLGVDARGRFSMVYGEGGGANRKDGGCCFVVRSADLGR